MVRQLRFLLRRLKLLWHMAKCMQIAVSHRVAVRHCALLPSGADPDGREARELWNELEREGVEEILFQLDLLTRSMRPLYIDQIPDYMLQHTADQTAESANKSTKN